jgi:hypothetical protein
LGQVREQEDPAEKEVRIVIPMLARNLKLRWVHTVTTFVTMAVMESVVVC